MTRIQDERCWWWERAFVYVGRMSEEKGVPQVVAAWLGLVEKLGTSCPPLWLVGGHPREVERMRLALGPSTLVPHERSGRLQWWGYVDAAGVSALLTRVLVLVAHSRYEPGGRVVIEAMSEGVPVIATPHGFARDLIEDWKTGFLVEFGDLETLQRRMEHFIWQPLLRNVLGAAAKDTAHQALNLWRFLDVHCCTYDQAMNTAQTAAADPTPQQDAFSRLDYFERRRFIPTYPWDTVEPDAESVRQFVEGSLLSSVDTIRSEVPRGGSSSLWIVECAGRSWIVKWPYPRLATRPLWNPMRRYPLVLDSKARFARERFAAGMPGFAPLTAFDEERQMLLRPLYSHVARPLEIEFFVEAYTLLRALYAYPVPSRLPMETLDRDWRLASWDEVVFALESFSEAIRGEEAPCDPDRHTSLRLAWRGVDLVLFGSDPPPIASWFADRRHEVSHFSHLAIAEHDSSPAFCHGSADPCHFLRDKDRNLVTIDGEHVHPAWTGEDFSALVVYAVKEMGNEAEEQRLWRRILDAVEASSQETSIVVSWAALLIAEELCKNSVLLRERQLSYYQARWRNIVELANDLRINQ